MASTSITSSVTTQTTVYLPTLLLDETNYPTWLFRLESFLKGQNLFGFVDGSIPCPPQLVCDSDGSNVLNSEYEAWKTQDQSVVNMLGQTLSPIALTCAVGSKSAHEMWNNLKLKFAASNRQNILQLKTNLQNLRKGSDNIETYLDKVKAARDALATVGVFLDDEDVVVTVLRGLPSEFAAIKTVIRAQYVSCSMPELKSLLQAAEIDIELETQGVTMPLTAMVAQSFNTIQNAPIFPANSAQSSPVAAPASPLSSTPTTPAQIPPTMPPGFTSPLTPAVTPPPVSSQATYVPIPTLPYGYGHYNPYTFFDPTFGMTGYYAGRGNGNGRFPRNHNFQARNSEASSSTSGGNGNAGYNRGITTSNNGNNNTFTCQICGKVGHGARTCRTLSNFQQGNNSNAPTCQYCGKNNHTADRCFFIIGFPNQQEASSSHGSAMLAAAPYAPQFWLADTGATNHMTSNAQLLTNVTQVPPTDSVQIGQGAGQDTVQRTE